MKLFEERHLSIESWPVTQLVTIITCLKIHNDSSRFQKWSERDGVWSAKQSKKVHIEALVGLITFHWQFRFLCYAIVHIPRSTSSSTLRRKHSISANEMTKRPIRINEKRGDDKTMCFTTTNVIQVICLGVWQLSLEVPWPTSLGES